MNDNMNLFYLMHNDDKVLILTIDETGNLIKASGVGNRTLLPLGGTKSFVELKKWWRRRAVPVSQGNVAKLLRTLGIPTTQSLLVQNLGLSLTDHYWIKPINSILRWESVNLYTNQFKESIVSFVHDTGTHVRVNGTPFYPGSSLQGELEKKWIIDANGVRCLVKGNYGGTNQQSANEVLATMLHKKLNMFPYTSYHLCHIDFDGDKLGCMCKNFSNIDTEFISAYDVMLSEKKANNVSDFEHFISVCGNHGLNTDYVRSFLEYQIMTDYILTNTDRHYNNFGVLRDTHTLKFIGLAPIFDTGNSMFWRNPSYPLNHNLDKIEVSGFRKWEKDLLKYLTNRVRLNYNCILNESDIRSILKYTNLCSSEISSIIKGYDKKVELLKKFMH